MNPSSDSSVIIVGAGPGGLATALLLAKAGLEVTIYEKQAKVGGRTSHIEQDGYTFDLGPTFFHYTEVIEEIFQAIGRDAHEELDLHRLDTNYRLIFGQGGQIDCSSDLPEMKERIRELSGDGDAEAFDRYVLDNRRKLEFAKGAPKDPGTVLVISSPSVH